MSSSTEQPRILRSLTTLPLVGGSVAVIGNPTAVDFEPTPVMLEAYSAWLNFELTYLNASILPPTRHGGVSMAVATRNDGAKFHLREMASSPSGSMEAAWQRLGLAAQRRAALVLSTVGCGWDGVQTFE